MAGIYETRFSVRNNFAITATTWTDLVGAPFLPISCSLIHVYNNNNVAVLMRTDPNNAASQIQIDPGQAYDIGVGSRSGPARFEVGSPNPVASFQSASGNVSLIIECVV